MDLHDAAIAYVEEFSDSPPISGVPPRLYTKAAELMSDAVERGEPLSDAEFYSALGLEVPPPDVKT